MPNQICLTSLVVAFVQRDNTLSRSSMVAMGHDLTESQVNKLIFSHCSYLETSAHPLLSNIW